MLITTATEHGITAFRASLLADNKPMRELFEAAGGKFHSEGSGVLVARVDLPANDRARAQLLYNMLRNACAGGIARARSILLNVRNL